MVVDDASSDGTRELLMELASEGKDRGSAPILEGCYELPTVNLKICFLPENRGKGAAIRHGFEQATGDVIVVQDADLEYDPNEYARLLAPIKAGQADVVFGSRFIGGPHRVLFFWHYVGNKLLTLLSNMATNLNLTDMETCYKMLRREVLANVRLEQNRWIRARVQRQGRRGHYRRTSPDLYTGGRTPRGRNGWKDGFAALCAS